VVTCSSSAKRSRCLIPSGPKPSSTTESVEALCPRNGRPVAGGRSGSESGSWCPSRGSGSSTWNPSREPIPVEPRRELLDRDDVWMDFVDEVHEAGGIGSAIVDVGGKR
jgi:hypothetical protein